MASLAEDTQDRLRHFAEQIAAFRAEGELDGISQEKLREYFRTQHIYHSTGIEGNRLTLSETMIVLKEGITISEKPIEDAIDVKNLGLAFDFFHDLAAQGLPISEHDLKQAHQLILGRDSARSAGQYRQIGVVISGAELVPPEPFELPMLMRELMEGLAESLEAEDPIVLAALAHHELAKIHPFVDGNGRTARLLMNLILMKKGYPICSIKRTERPAYYEAMAQADAGNYQPLVEMVLDNCAELFSHYVRIREESQRVQRFAEKWGQKDLDSRLKREKGRYELWNARMAQVKLSFQQIATILDEQMPNYSITQRDYPPITFNTFEQLETRGTSVNSFFFSIRFTQRDTRHIVQTIVFRFFRDAALFPKSDLIPLDVNPYDKETRQYLNISQFPWAERLRLRYIYFDGQGELHIGEYDRQRREIVESQGQAHLQAAIERFFEDIFEHILGLA